MVFHASLAGRELPGWSRCMSPALLTSFLHSASLFYILIATAMTNYGKKIKSALSEYLGALGFPTARLDLHLCASWCSLLIRSSAPSWRTQPRPKPIQSSHHHPTWAGGKSKWVGTQRRDKTDGRLCLFCLAQGSLPDKASNEDNDE